MSDGKDRFNNTVDEVVKVLENSGFDEDQTTRFLAELTSNSMEHSRMNNINTTFGILRLEG